MWAAVQLVVVDDDLRVERLDGSVRCGDQGVDLGERGADRVHRRVQLLHDVGGGAGLRHVLVQRETETERLVRQQSVAGVHAEPVDLLGGLGGHFLDVDAARGTHHQHGALRRAVDDDADVALRCDISRGRHEHLVYREPLDRHAKDGAGMRLRFGRGFRQLDAARFAAAAGVNLGLDDDFAAEPLRDRFRFGGRRRDLAWRHRNAVPPQDVARLVLVQVHPCSFVMVVPASPWSAARPCASSAMMARSPPARTKSAAASTLGRMLPDPSSFPASI